MVFLFFFLSIKKVLIQRPPLTRIFATSLLCEKKNSLAKAQRRKACTISLCACLLLGRSFLLCEQKGEYSREACLQEVGFLSLKVKKILSQRRIDAKVERLFLAPSLLCEKKKRLLARSLLQAFFLWEPKKNTLPKTQSRKGSETSLYAFSSLREKKSTRAKPAPGFLSLRA